LLVATAGALALVFTAVALASPQFKQTVDIKYTNNHSKVSTGIKANLFARDPGATPAGNQKGANKVTVTFVGARFDYKAGKRCKLPQTQATNCPKSTQIGSGSAVGNAVTKSNPPTVAQGIKYTVKAYLKKGGIYMVVQGTGGPFVLNAPFSKRGKLSVNVQRDVVNQPVPQQLGLKPVLTDFKLKVKPKTKGRGSKKRILLRTPKCGKSKRFKIVTKFVYEDGSRSTHTNRQKCRK
jgi:hypothetical protein